MIQHSGFIKLFFRRSKLGRRRSLAPGTKQTHSWELLGTTKHHFSFERKKREGKKIAGKHWGTTTAREEEGRKKSILEEFSIS